MAGGAGRFQQILVGTQLALVVPMLLCGTVLLMSVRNLLSVELGFQPEQVHAVRFGFQSDNYGPRGALLQAAALDEIARLPSIEQAAWTSELPLSAAPRAGLRLESGDPAAAVYRIVSAGYFDTLGAVLLRGGPGPDWDSGRQPLAIVNRTFVDRYFADEASLGRRVFTDRWHTIVGVVADIHEGRLDEPPTPTVYWSFAGGPWMAGAPWLVARFRDAATGPEGVLQQVVTDTAPDLPLVAGASLRQLERTATAEHRFLTAAIALMAAVGGVIAAMAVWSAASYGVRRRRREFGLRKALGASHPAIAWTAIRALAIVAASGVATGGVVSFVAVGWIRTFVFGVEPFGPGILAVTAFAVIAIVAVAAAGPVWRAVRTEPSVVLSVD